MKNECSAADLLRVHALRYPKMEPTDTVKLLYQREFGGGHLLADPTRAHAFLLREYAATPQREDIPLYELLGNGRARLYLAAMDAHGVTPAMAWEWFETSSRAPSGTKESFLCSLDDLRVLTDEGVFGFSADALDVYLRAYAEQGYPMVSHSAAYREAYAPAYRVGAFLALRDADGVCQHPPTV